MASSGRRPSAASITSGVRAEFNADVFYQQIVPVLVKAIETKRAELRTAILGGFTATMAARPMSVAFADAIRYNDSCSLVTAESTLAEKLTLASHPGLIEHNQALLLVNSGRAIQANPKLTDSALLNPDGTLKATTKP